MMGWPRPIKSGMHRGTQSVTMRPPHKRHYPDWHGSGKNIFRINCLAESGKCVLNKNLHRKNVIQFFAQLKECTVVMDACVTSHYWGQTFTSMGHTVKLIHPRYVTPFRLGEKNDANDAAAICAAAQRPSMSFVRLHSQRQSDVQALHRVREGLVSEKTTTVNIVRSLLAENSIVIKQWPANIFALLPTVVDDLDNDLSSMMRQRLRVQYRHLLCICTFGRTLTNAANDCCRR